MTLGAPTAAVAPPGQQNPAARNRSKLDLWICWCVLPVFYTLFGVIFVLLTRVMPPPSPDKSVHQITMFFLAHATTIKVGFVLLMAVIGLGSISNGLVAYQMKRMSVNPVFAYGYIATLAVAALPGCLFAAIFFLVAVFRPDRNPHLIALCYDAALLSFVGSLGCFVANYAVFALAVLLDKNNIFPRWIGYMAIWQIVTEFMAAPVFIFKKGPFAWNGAIAFFEGTAIFVIFLVCLIFQVRRAIEQQPPGERVPD
jgi:hypothetical protein